MSDFLNNLGKIGMVLQAGGGSLAGRDGMAVVRDWEKQQEDARKREAISGLLAQSGIGGIQRGLLEQLPVDQQAPAILNMLAQMEAQRRAGGAAAAAAAQEAAERQRREQAFLDATRGGAAPQAGGYSFGERVTDVMPPSQPLSFGRALPPAAIEQSVLPPAAGDSWQFPQTFPNADPMAGSVVAQSPALASRPVPPVVSPQEVPPRNLSFGERVNAPPAPPNRFTIYDNAYKQELAKGPFADPVLLESYDRLRKEFAPPEQELFDADRYRVVGNTLYDLADLDENGRPRAVADGQGQQEVVFGPDGQPILARGPAGSDFKFTEGQSKDNVYVTRATGALAVLEPVADRLTSRLDRAAELDPTGFSRELQNPDFQVAQQAGEEFLQAILRKDTGAAITSDEQFLYGRTFLPRPGDGPEVLRAKRDARQRAIAAIRAGMSPAQILATERALGEVPTPELPPQQGPEQTRPATARFAEMTLEQLLLEENIPTTEAEAAEWNKRYEALQ